MTDTTYYSCFTIHLATQWQQAVKSNCCFISHRHHILQLFYNTPRHPMTAGSKIKLLFYQSQTPHTTAVLQHTSPPILQRGIVKLLKWSRVGWSDQKEVESFRAPKCGSIFRLGGYVKCMWMCAVSVAGGVIGWSKITGNMCSCTHTLPHTHRHSQTMAEYHVCATSDNVTLTPTLRSVTHLYCQLYQWQSCSRTDTTHCCGGDTACELSAPFHILSHSHPRGVWLTSTVSCISDSQGLRI